MSRFNGSDVQGETVPDVRFGLSGFASPALRPLYGREGPSLARYAEHFGIWEMECSMRSEFDAAAAERVLDQAPATLRLAPRVPMPSASHDRSSIDAWSERLAPILHSRRCGPVSFAWPGPWSMASEASLDATLDALWQRLDSGATVAVEFQDGSWFRGDALRLLEEHEACLVWSTRAGLVPYRATGPELYVRLTGQKARRQDEVAAFVERLRARRHDRPVSVIGTRHQEAYGLHSIERMARALGRPLWLEPGETDQATLRAFASA